MVLVLLVLVYVLVLILCNPAGETMVHTRAGAVRPFRPPNIQNRNKAGISIGFKEQFM